MCYFLVKAALYSSTDVANLYLAKGSAKSLHDMIIYQSQTIYPLWNNIADAVRLVFPAGRPVPPLPSSGGPLLHHRWKGGVRTSAEGQRTSPGFIFSVRAGRERTRMKRLLAFQQRRSSRPFTGLCLLGGSVDGAAPVMFSFNYPSDLRRRW